MTRAQIHLLNPWWETNPSGAILEDPWDRVVAPVARQRSSNSSIFNRPDFGWSIAGRLAKSGRQCTLLKRPEYSWLRAAVQLLAAGDRTSRRLKDAAVVARARDIHESDLRPIVNALLMTASATAQKVADALKVDTAVVSAYDSLFFNVLDRQDDIAFRRHLLGTSEAKNSLLVSRRAIPTDEEVLLLIGSKGTIEDVLHHAGCGGGAGGASVEDLADGLLRDLLVAGTDWMSSLRSRRESPPAVVSHAIDFVKKVKADTADVAPVQTGMGIGAIMRDQLEKDASAIRGSMALDVNMLTN